MKAVSILRHYYQRSKRLIGLMLVLTCIISIPDRVQAQGHCSSKSVRLNTGRIKDQGLLGACYIVAANYLYNHLYGPFFRAPKDVLNVSLGDMIITYGKWTVDTKSAEEFDKEFSPYYSFGNLPGGFGGRIKTVITQVSRYGICDGRKFTDYGSDLNYLGSVIEMIYETFGAQVSHIRRDPLFIRSEDGQLIARTVMEGAIVIGDAKKDHTELLAGAKRVCKRLWPTMSDPKCAEIADSLVYIFEWHFRDKSIGDITKLLERIAVNLNWYRSALERIEATAREGWGPLDRPFRVKEQYPWLQSVSAILRYISDARCAPRPAQNPVPSPIEHDSDGFGRFGFGNRAIEFIDRNLNYGYPTGIGYKTEGLFLSKDLEKKISKDRTKFGHASAIVGRRLFREHGEDICYYLAMNTWGDDWEPNAGGKVYKAYDSKGYVLGGYFWISESELRDHVQNVVAMKIRRTNGGHTSQGSGGYGAQGMASSPNQPQSYDSSASTSEGEPGREGSSVSSEY